jgi:hypothetical protein
MANGTTAKGHWCEVCRFVFSGPHVSCAMRTNTFTRHRGAPKSWLTGGVSTLRKHINRSVPHSAAAARPPNLIDYIGTGRRTVTRIRASAKSKASRCMLVSSRQHLKTRCEMAILPHSCNPNRTSGQRRGYSSILLSLSSSKIRYVSEVHLLSSADSFRPSILLIRDPSEEF